MTPFKEEGHHITLKLLYNKKHKYGQFVVENVFKILKNDCKEFFTKFDLPIYLLFMILSLFFVYCIVYNDKKLKLM
jgi:hypothetical protein